MSYVDNTLLCRSESVPECLRIVVTFTTGAPRYQLWRGQESGRDHARPSKASVTFIALFSIVWSPHCVLFQISTVLY